MDIEFYMTSLQAGRCRVAALTKKGDERVYIGSLPEDAEQRIPGSDVVPILLEDGTYKSFDVSRVISFEPFYEE